MHRESHETNSARQRIIFDVPSGGIRKSSPQINRSAVKHYVISDKKHEDKDSSLGPIRDLVKAESIASLDHNCI